MALTKEQKQDIIVEKHRIHGSSDCVDDGTN